MSAAMQVQGSPRLLAVALRSACGAHCLTSTGRDCSSFFKDLPPRNAPGRDGKGAQPLACAVRVARAQASTREIRDSLAHLLPEVDRKTMTTMVSKYRCLPEEYYDGSEPITPDKAIIHMAEHKEELNGGVKFWELCSGTSVLSKLAHDTGLGLCQERPSQERPSQ